MLKFKNLSDVKPSKIFLFYGKTGTGKTTLSGTFPKPCIIDANEMDGASSIGNIIGENCTIDNYEDFEEFVKNIDKYYTEKKFETLIIDTVDGVQNLNLKSLAKNGKVTLNNYADSNYELQQIFLKVIEFAKEKDLYLIFNSHEKDNTIADDTTGEILNPNVGPQITPKLSEWLQAVCSIVGHTRKVEKKNDLGQSQGIYYCIKIGPDAVFKTKVRVPKDQIKANVIVNPTCEKLMSVLNGTYGEKKEGNK